MRPFPQQEFILAMILGYRNSQYVHGQVLPEVSTNKETYKYFKVDLGESLRVGRKTEVSRKGTPQTIETFLEEDTGKIKNHALIGEAPLSDSDEAPEGYDPYLAVTEEVMEANKLEREMRAVNFYKNEANFGLLETGIKLKGDKDIVQPILELLETPVLRPNTLVLGAKNWLQFRTNPSLIKSITRGEGDKGILTPQEVADIFELDQVIIGRTKGNLQKPGAEPKIVSLWDDEFSLVYLDKDMKSPRQKRLTFAMTVKNPKPIFDTDIDKKSGTDGIRWIKAGERVQEHLVCKDLGIKFKGTLAA